MTSQRRVDQKRRGLIVALIILIPLVPAIIVQVLVRRSPPGTSITPTMSEVIGAMQALPKPDPSAEPLVLESRFTTGEVFEIEVYRRVKVDDDSPLVSESVFELEVLEATEASAQLRLRVSKPAGAKILQRDQIDFRWDVDGFMVASEDEGPLIRDLRDLLLKHHGLFFLGSFERQQPVYDWIAEPGREPSDLAIEEMVKLDSHPGREEMPHRGGFLALPEVSGQQPFQLLAYRRFAIETAGEKIGVYECVQRGRLETANARPQLGNGEIRITERLSWNGPKKTNEQVIQIYSRQSIKQVKQELN